MMRSLFLILLLANLLFVAVQFNVFGDLVHESKGNVQPAPLNAERLRIIRDTSTLPRRQAVVPAAAAPSALTPSAAAPSAAAPPAVSLSADAPAAVAAPAVAPPAPQQQE